MVIQHSAEVHADVRSAPQLDAELSGQQHQILPQSIQVHYIWKASCGWKIMSIFITGPVVRKRDGELSSRDATSVFNSGAGTLPDAPAWASELAEQNRPGGDRPQRDASTTTGQLIEASVAAGRMRVLAGGA